jgi:SAM-dependent methyltransferase
MHYDPVKAVLGRFFSKAPWLRKLFYRLMDLLFLRTWYIKKEIKIWAKYQKDDVRILDAGSGYGQYSFHLSGINKNWFIKGVDVKQEQVDDCNSFFKRINKTNVSFEYADLTAFQEKEKFDFILNVDVMEHIEEDVMVFKNFYASLKKNGMLLISTPSDQGGSDVHEHGGETSFIGEHVRDGYAISDITEKLKSAGFEKTECYYSYGKPGQAAWKLSMKYPVQMLGVSKVFFIALPFYYLIFYPVAYILNYIDVSGSHPTGTGLVVKAWKHN